MPKAPDQHRPLSGHGPVVLKRESSPRWLELAVSRFDEVLVDHAHCEKKAAASALSLLQSYPEVPGLAAQMARLAREEAGHLSRVLALMEQRGLSLGHDPGDPYVRELLALTRSPHAERRCDRLLIAAIIEARSCERLALLAGGLAEESLRSFYAELAQSEDGHQALFYRLAVTAQGQEQADRRLEELLLREAEVLDRLPLRPAVH